MASIIFLDQDSSNGIVRGRHIENEVLSEVWCRSRGLLECIKRFLCLLIPNIGDFCAEQADEFVGFCCILWYKVVKEFGLALDAL